MHPLKQGKQLYNHVSSYVHTGLVIFNIIGLVGAEEVAINSDYSSVSFSVPFLTAFTGL